MQGKGLSLLELLVVVALVGILATALLWRTSDARGAAITQATYDLRALIQRGRLEAIARNRQTLLIFSTGAGTVSLCVETSSPNGSCDATDTVLTTWRVARYGQGLNLQSASFGTNNSLLWTPTGLPSGLGGTPGALISSGNLNRRLCLSLAGQVSIRQGSC